MIEWYKTKEQVQKEKEIELLNEQIQKLKLNLEDTDHKVFTDYEPKEGEDLEAIIQQRSDWRTEVRRLIKLLEDEKNGTTEKN